MIRRLSFIVLAVAIVVTAVVLLWRPPAPKGGGVSLSDKRTPMPDVPVTGTPMMPMTPVPAASQTPSDVPKPTRGAAAPPTPGVSTIAAGPVSNAGGEPVAAITTQGAMIDLDKTQRMIRDYHTRMGENPVGTNAEIMKAVMGGNSRQAVLGPGEGQHLNARGELVDPWGTPYFFHQLSGDHMEIHSAGPDRVMGTEDDLVLK